LASIGGTGSRRLQSHNAARIVEAPLSLADPRQQKN
jgi:hypothetical protein